MANKNRTEKIIQCRIAITFKVTDTGNETDILQAMEVIVSVMQSCCCPLCKKGRLVLMEEIPKRAGPVWFKAA